MGKIYYMGKDYTGFEGNMNFGITPISMIGSNGAQKLTLPYYADDGISIEFKMMLSYNEPNTVILGDNFNYDGTVLYISATGTNLGARTQEAWVSEDLPYETWKMVNVKLDIANGIFTIDGIDYGIGHVPTTHPENKYLSLFDIYSGGRGSSVAISEVSIKQNDVEVMHLVPMKNSQTGAGYYHDDIGGQDYYSEGNKDFVYTEFGNASVPTPTRFTPKFSETLLIDNSNYNASFTFTDDYHNYDIIKVIICDLNSGDVFAVIHTTPSTLDKCFSFAWGLVCFDRYDSTDHCDYTQNGLTWTISDRYRSSNCIIKEIYGIKCTNGVAVETTVYDHNSLSNPFVTVNYDGSFKDEFDILFICANSTDGEADEIMPTINQIYTDTLFYRDSVDIILNRYNNYNNITYTDNKLSSWYYFFVVGIKFLPNSN